jgi:hypothetical protein
MVYAYVLTFQNIGGNYFIVLIVWSIIWRVQFWFFFSFVGFGYDALFHFKVWTCFLFYLLFYFVYCFFFSLDFVFWLFGPSKAVMLLIFCICFTCGFTFMSSPCSGYWCFLWLQVLLFDSVKLLLLYMSLLPAT